MANIAVPELRLKPKEERRLIRGHLWVYRNELQEVPALEDGALVDVLSAAGRFVGRAFYQAEGGIAARILARRREAIDAAWFGRRIQAARAFRERLFPGEEVYRWVYGESDGLPGLVADRYGPVVSAETSCAFYVRHIEVLAQTFLAQDGVEGLRIVVQGHAEALTFGLASPRVNCTLDGLRLEVRLDQAQKTGLFLDQRVNWRRMGTYAPGARVLDGHCYAGLWSCGAARAGAASVLGVDTSSAALAAAEVNARLNGVEKRCRFERADILAVLQQQDERFDLIVIDPPALAKARSQTKRALGMYQTLNRAAIQALEPGGILITCSCSHFVSRDEFLDMLKRAVIASGRRGWVLETAGAAPDHPVLLTMPETDYLKCVTLRVF